MGRIVHIGKSASLRRTTSHPSTEAFPGSGDTKFQHVEAAELHYTRAVKQFFDWRDEHRLGLADVEAITLATYIEELGTKTSKPTVKPVV